MGKFDNNSADQDAFLLRRSFWENAQCLWILVQLKIFSSYRNFRAECESNVKGFSGAQYKKFSTLSEAQAFCQGPATATANSNESYQSITYIPYSQSSSAPSKHKFFEETARPTCQNRNLAYVDGSCLGNGTAAATAGYGVYFPETAKYNLNG